MYEVRDKAIDVQGMIAKVEFSADIARIALDCPSCKGHVSKAIERFRNRQIALQTTKQHGF